MAKRVNRKCSLWWCKRKHYAQGLCYKHYLNVYRHSGIYATTDTELKIVVKKCDELALIIMMLTEPYNQPLLTCIFCHEQSRQHKRDCIVLTARDAVYDIIDDYNAKGRKE